MVLAGSSSHASHLPFNVFIGFNRHEEDNKYKSSTRDLYKILCIQGMKVFMDDDGGGGGGSKKKVLMDEDNVSDKIVKAIETYRYNWLYTYQNTFSRITPPKT
ncbi:hypothetical protein Csa_008636 [Cucumis sativus]|uniref:TIR domain-containing protein n=1 Tax=Cucumis sativus TaxID=3659 RepID=A0A0A0KSQ6_CUCSA|nr:hypothetical protein Csa_008636 [Cucumis sativus]